MSSDSPLSQAGLSGSSRWQEFSSLDPDVQVLEQAQSSRWSLSTAGTPLEGFFPSNLRSFSRSKRVAASASTSDLRAKSLYEESVHKRTLFTKGRKEEPFISPVKNFHHLTVMIDVHWEKINTKDKGFESPCRDTESPTSTTSNSSGSITSPIVEAKKHWKRRKNSLGKIVGYLGKLLPRRVDSQKQNVAPPLPKGGPQPLRRSETTIRRPRRSSELHNPNKLTTRWSMASTQAIRAERFSFEPRSRSPKGLETNVQSLLKPIPPPLPALSRSVTQPGSPRRGNDVVRSKQTRLLLKRSRSERNLNRFPLSHETSSETVASIADRIIAKEIKQYHDSWDFLDYYTQSFANPPRTQT